MRPTPELILSKFDSTSPSPTVRAIHTTLVNMGYYAGEEQRTSYQHVLRTLKNNDRIKQDPRRTYTIAELSNLMLMSPAQRAGFAERTGRSVRAVYAAISRYKQALKYTSSPHNKMTMAQKFMVDRGYFNFSNPYHLQLLSITPKQMKRAQRVLRDHNLYMRSPQLSLRQRGRGGDAAQ